MNTPDNAPSILKLIYKNVLEVPDHIAIKHNDEVVSYQKLWQLSSQLESKLLQNSLVRGDIVAIAMDRSLEMSLIMLACLKMGVTYLPLDPSFPIDRVKFLVDDAGAKAFITFAKYSNTYEQFNPMVFEDVLTEKPNIRFEYGKPSTNLSNNVYIIYTSGSTGLPKGVAVQEKNLLNLLLHRIGEPGLVRSDNVLGLNSLSFDISQEELYLPLLVGARLTIIDQDITRDGSALLNVVKKESITLMQATPYIWQMMIEAGWEEKLPMVVFCGGESVTKKLAQQLLLRCEAVWNMYGPTETSICALAKQLKENDEVITIGYPISNTSIYILDRNMNEVKPGEEGELYIGGAGVTNGYINRPELTKEKFLKNPVERSKEEICYRTGDLVKLLPNGELLFIDRIDLQIKLRGHRVEVGEIEQQILLNNCIIEALVNVYTDELGVDRLIAYLVLQDEVQKGWGDLIKNLKLELEKKLPSYMIPWAYVELGEIPLLPSGKINRNSLPKPIIANDWTLDAPPGTKIEKIIAKIWQVNIGVAKISIYDDFFELGGNSLIALRTKIQIEKQLSVRLSPSILFKYPTVKALSEMLDSENEEAYKALVPIRATGSKMPLYIVHGIGLNVLGFRSMVSNLDVDQPVYGLQAFEDVKNHQVFESIENIAAFYNEEIIKNQPKGPYAISGYSIGGIIAYEMARQLKELDKEVNFLGIFDTNLQLPTHQYKFVKRFYSNVIRQIAKASFRINLFYLKPTKNIRYLKSNLYRNWKKIFYRHVDFPNYPEYMLNKISKIMDAFYQYVLVPSNITVDLFIADNMYYLDDPEYLGWSKYALAGVNTYKLEGNHVQIFEAPYDANFAKLLQKRLNEVN